VAVSKSWAGRRKALLLALNTDLAGMQILFIRRRYNDVYENHIFPLSLELNKFFKFKGDTKSFDFPWGSRIIFGYCDHEKDILNYQGKAYDCIFVEEATQFTPFMLQSLTESLRPSGFMKSYHNWNPRMYYTMNPGGEHNVDT
jgi:phage terminase large subunit